MSIKDVLEYNFLSWINSALLCYTFYVCILCETDSHQRHIAIARSAHKYNYTNLFYNSKLQKPDRTRKLLANPLARARAHLIKRNIAIKDESTSSINRRRNAWLVSLIWAKKCSFLQLRKHSSGCKFNERYLYENFLQHGPLGRWKHPALRRRTE